MSKRIPYPHQLETINEILKYLKEKPGKNGLVLAPTGSGKSVIIACICQLLLRRPKVRLMVISDSGQILLQDYEAVKKQVDCEVGLYSSGLERSDIKERIIIAGIQSVFKKSDLFKDRTLFLIDEAHKVGLGKNSRYITFFRTLTQPKLGFTATGFRNMQGYLHQGENAFFHDVISEIEIRDLQATGRLCFMKSAGTETKLDPSGIKKFSGDYSIKDLSLKFDVDSVTKRAVRELLRFKDLRKRWLVFGINTNHADNISAELNRIGIRSNVVHSKLKGKINTEVINSFRVGEYQALVSVGMLTTGFDVPEIDLIVLLRPTASSVLHVQMIGRGLRTADGKEDCLVVDYCGNLIRCGPIDNPIIKIPGKGGGESKAPLKECLNENCRAIIAAATRTCPECGYEFEFIHKVSSIAVEAPVISEPLEFEVVDVSYSIYTGKRDIPMMLVRYQCGIRRFIEYICFEHPHETTRVLAQYWWKTRNGAGQPRTCQEAVALSAYLKKPKTIIVDQSGKYTDIKKYNF